MAAADTVGSNVLRLGLEFDLELLLALAPSDVNAEEEGEDDGESRTDRKLPFRLLDCCDEGVSCIPLLPRIPFVGFWFEVGLATASLLAIKAA